MFERNPRWPPINLNDYAGWPADAIEDALLYLFRARGEALGGSSIHAEKNLRYAVQLLDWSESMRARWERGEFESRPPEAPPSVPGDPAWAPPPPIDRRSLAVVDVATKAAGAGNLGRANELIGVAATMLAPAAHATSKNAARIAGQLTSGFDPRDLMRQVEAFKRDLKINPVYKPGPSASVRQNPPRGDERLRALQRTAAGGAAEDRLRFAHERRRRGLRVDPWELNPLSYLFLEAANSWGWSGVKPTLGTPHRVEGKRLTFQGSGVQIRTRRFLQQRTRPLDLVTLAAGVRRARVLESGDKWRNYTEVLNEPLLIDNQPFRSPSWRTGTQTQWHTEDVELQGMSLAPHPAVPTERFYVVPSSYPMYRGWDDFHALTDPTFVQEAMVRLGLSGPSANQELEMAIHEQAVRWYVDNGAIPYLLPDTPDVTKARAGGQVGALSTPSERGFYLRWWDVYRQRVLVCVENRKGASGFTGGHMTDRIQGQQPGFGGAPDHNTKILIPRFWDKARLMTRKGKRWKNNPRRARRNPPSKDDLSDPGFAAVILAGDVIAGGVSPEEAEARCSFIAAAAAGNSWAMNEVAELRGHIESAKLLRSVARQARGKRSLHLRSLRPGWPMEVMIHPATRGDAPKGSWQITTFGPHSGSDPRLVPYGHTSRPSVAAALKEAWGEHGPMELVSSDPRRLRSNPQPGPWAADVSNFDLMDQLPEAEAQSAIDRALEVGAVPPLTYQGAGGSGIVFCDQRWHAFKVARHPLPRTRRFMQSEVDWFRAAAAHPATANMVPRIYAFHPDQVVIERECPRGKGPGWRDPWWDWHQSLSVPGWTSPESGDRQWIVTDRGPVIIDGGYALRRGKVLAQHVEDVLEGRKPGYGESLKDMAWAIYTDTATDHLPPWRGIQLLERLRAAGDVSEYSSADTIAHLRGR